MDELDGDELGYELSDKGILKAICAAHLFSLGATVEDIAMALDLDDPGMVALLMAVAESTGYGDAIWAGETHNIDYPPKD